MEDPPEAVAWLVRQLRDSGFEQVSEDQSASFGDLLLVFRRPPVELRLIRDRGQWTADLSGEGWPESDRLPLPLFEGFGLRD
jgi:hypothetical protein